MGHLEIRDGEVWGGGRAGNYGTVKYYLDEAAGETAPIQVLVQGHADGAPASEVEAQVFSNVNRRDAVMEAETFAVPPAVPLWLDAHYQAVKLGADNPGQPLWPAARRGSVIRRDGVFVRLRALPKTGRLHAFDKRERT